VQDAKFRPSRSCRVRECPKLRTLPPPSINAGAVNLCAMSRRVYLIQFVIFFSGLLDSGVGARPEPVSCTRLTSSSAF
jgi:hypothetical protein